MFVHNKVVAADVRVVCATHRRLETMVEDGQFREDLIFRINAFEIELPPLRLRVGDIPPLAAHLLRRVRIGCALPDEKLFTDGALEQLTAHVWPGNVRELANVVEHASILCDELPIDAEHLPRRFADRRLNQELRTIGPMSLRELEMQAIHESLERHGGSKPKAAEELGVSLKTLYNKLNQTNELGKTA